MNALPLLGFYYRRHAQIAAMMDAGKRGDSSHVVLDFARALAPPLKEHFPSLNKDGLVDDALQTLEAMLTEQDNPYPDPTQR